MQQRDLNERTAPGTRAL